MDAVIITKAQLLEIKESGKYSCHHYIPPNAMKEMLEEYEVTMDEEALKLFTEITENFATSLLTSAESRLISTEDIYSLIGRLNIINGD